LNRSEEAVLVQRLHDARIHHLRLDEFSRQHLGASQRAGHLDRSGVDRNIALFAPHGGVGLRCQAVSVAQVVEFWLT
jgi:hypothetical protein